MSTAPYRSAEAATPGGGFGAARLGRVAVGLAVILDCFLAGEAVKARLGLIVPGSVLGLFLLLILLVAGLVPVRWVEEASRLLLFVLPASFVPIYVLAAEDHALWREWGLVIAGSLAVTVILLWLFVGWLARWAFGKAGEVGP